MYTNKFRPFRTDSVDKHANSSLSSGAFQTLSMCPHASRTQKSEVFACLAPDVLICRDLG